MSVTISDDDTFPEALDVGNRSTAETEINGRQRSSDHNYQVFDLKKLGLGFEDDNPLCNNLEIERKISNGRNNNSENEIDIVNDRSNNLGNEREPVNDSNNLENKKSSLKKNGARNPSSKGRRIFNIMRTINPSSKGRRIFNTMRTMNSISRCLFPLFISLYAQASNKTLDLKGIQKIEIYKNVYEGSLGNYLSNQVSKQFLGKKTTRIDDVEINVDYNMKLIEEVLIEANKDTTLYHILKLDMRTVLDSIIYYLKRDSIKFEEVFGKLSIDEKFLKDSKVGGVIDNLKICKEQNEFEEGENFKKCRNCFICLLETVEELPKEKNSEFKNDFLKKFDVARSWMEREKIEYNKKNNRRRKRKLFKLTRETEKH